MKKNKIHLWLTHFFLLLAICSVKKSENLQWVVIKFQPVLGAKYYQIRLLPDKEGKPEEIIKVNQTNFKKNISSRHHSFQIRAVFSEEVATKWSIIHKFDQLQRKVDHSHLTATNNIRYRTVLQIRSQYYHRNNILWVGSNTQINFAPGDPSFAPKKEIFYRFRKKGYKGPAFTPFVKPILLKRIFADVDGAYLLEYYSINNEKVKEKLSNTLVFVDTKPPEIKFEETKTKLVWRMNDKSIPIEALLYVNGSLLARRKQVYNLIVRKSEIGNVINSIRLTASDFLGNQTSWKK